MVQDTIINLIDLSLGFEEKGGPGSGHRGHKGIKGRRGGSAPSQGRSLAGRYGEKSVSVADIGRNASRHHGDNESTYNAEIVPGKAIRIHGEVKNRLVGSKPFDLTFEVGDPARVVAGQLAERRGNIVKITKNTVTVKDSDSPYYTTNKRLSLYSFSYYNCFGEEIHRSPTITIEEIRSWQTKK